MSKVLAVALSVPSLGLSTLGADYAFNQSRIRQCLAEGTEQLVKSPVRSVEIKPVVGGKVKPQLVKNSTQLLPPLKYTNANSSTYDPASLKSYKVVDLQGRTITIELYKATYWENGYYDKQGVEYSIRFDEANQIYRMSNIQKISGSDSFQVFEKGANQYLMMQPFADFNQSKAYLEKQGLEVVGILGTSYIGKTSQLLKNKNIEIMENSVHFKEGDGTVGYKYLNIARLNPASKEPVIEYGLSFMQPNEILHLKSGFYTTLDGKATLLDFRTLSNTEIKQTIEKLKQNKRVVAITLNGFGTDMQQPEGKSIAQARAFMAFDKDGDFLGSFVSSPVGIPDIVTIAKAKYGDKVGKVINLDGDFYAKAMLYYDDIPFNQPDAERFIAGMLLVQPKATLPANVVKLEVKPSSNCAYAVASGMNALGDVKVVIETGNYAKLWNKLTGKT